MRLSKTTLIAFLFVIILAGCAGPPKELVRGDTETGMASWYGSDFHGRPTASGEIYNMNAMTAAHKTLPLGAIVDVENLDNGRRVEVTVNDRGPFVRGRIIDLSYSAAKEIDMAGSGTARVRIKVLGRDSRYIKRVKVDETGGGDYFTVQLGSFTEKENAERLKTVVSWKYSGVHLEKAEGNGRTFYRVRLAKFKDRAKALKLAETLADEGYESVVMRD